MQTQADREYRKRVAEQRKLFYDEFQSMHVRLSRLEMAVRQQKLLFGVVQSMSDDLSRQRAAINFLMKRR